MPSPTPPTDAPVKILLVDTGRHNPCFRSLTVDATKVEWLPLDPKQDFETVLGTEHFDIIIADYRETQADVIAEVKEIRKRQPKAQILLVCRKLELQDIARAIRLGVRDVFNPPLDVRALTDQLESLARGGKPSGKVDATVLERWRELTLHLAGTPSAESPAPPATGIDDPRSGSLWLKRWIAFVSRLGRSNRDSE